MSKSQRDKGNRGHREAVQELLNRDWHVVETRGGKKSDDAIAIDPNGRTWSVEIKNQTSIRMKDFEKQAREQAKDRKLPWMLMVKIAGHKAFLVARKNMPLTLWSQLK